MPSFEQYLFAEAHGYYRDGFDYRHPVTHARVDMERTMKLHRLIACTDDVETAVRLTVPRGGQ